MQTYTRNELVTFLGGWILSEPTLTIQAARRYGARNGFSFGRRDFDEARRSVRVVKLPEPATAVAEATPVTVLAPGRMAETVSKEPPMTESKQTPLSAWMRGYLTANPAATFAEAKTAAAAAGHEMKRPIAFGLARKALGMVPQGKPRAPKLVAVEPLHAGPRRLKQAGAVEPKRRSVGLDSAAITAALRDFQAVIAERDRLRRALDEIGRVVRGVV